MVQVHEDAMPSSPPPLSDSLETLPSSPPPMRPKGKPPITPRSFRRFFTPRSSLNGPNTRQRTSRNALRDITSPALNRLGPAFPGFSEHSDFTISKSSPNLSRTPSKKRKLSFSSSSYPLQSSPLSRIRIAPPIFTDVESEQEEITPSSPIEEQQQPARHHSLLKPTLPPPPLRRSKVLQSAANFYSRNITGSRGPRTTIRASSNIDWQIETADFYSQSQDSHICRNGGNPVLPFCTASCNTNSLVAIGDEGGYIRLLDSAADDKHGFSHAYLTFPSLHLNSILDLEFSSDDMLLATASGDQTSHIIDMTTQTPIYRLSKHTSSVKRVQFQPTSNNNVVATCSRDGSVNIWDLRYKAYDKPAMQVMCSLGNDGDDDSVQPQPKMKYAQVSKTIRGAHSDRYGDQETQSRREDTTVTSIAFLQAGREHLFVTSSESNASVRLWDLRTTYSLRRAAVPLAATQQPDSHTRYRQFGLTSMTFNTDGSRLYTLCRDGTVYAYSTPHLLLGNSPEMCTGIPNDTLSRRYPAEQAKPGLGPIYGFRHPQLIVGSFFVKIALRRAAKDNTELLAVGSSDNCPIIFPTDEQYLNPAKSTTHAALNDDCDNGSLPESSSQVRRGLKSPRSPLGLRRTNSSVSLAERLEHTIPIYQHGTPLIEGHQREVSGVSWTQNGELISVSDDLSARCWREGPMARTLRCDDGPGGHQWQCGWADVKKSYDKV
ncbi:hypothetical protein FQN57_005059 [Myotisia sp. PD_48]|nr:hypothetical protein FQN57_005059 [Myotisia sp. PD_48]